MPTRPWVLVVAGALLTVLAYPPFHLFLPSFIALVPLYWLLDRAALAKRPARGAWYGLVAGLAANGALHAWMVVALQSYAAYPIATYLLAVLLLSLWWAVLGWWVVRVWIALPKAPRWLVFAAGWTVMEWIFGHHGALAFPWLGLGTSLTGFPLVIQWADLAGARGVTFWLVVSNALLARGLESPAREWRRLAAVLVTIPLALGYGALRVRGLDLRPVGQFLLVQSDVKPHDKQDPARWAASVDALLDQTELALAESPTRPDLVLWPEAAVPADADGTGAHMAAVAALAREARVALLVGMLEPDAPGSTRRYNSAVLLDAGGRMVQGMVYRKRYLVPVAERGTIVPGDGGPLFPVGSGHGRGGVVICFEVGFERLARAYRRAGAHVLLNVSNDAWARRTWARSQHPAHLVMRAIETRMGIARVANTGVSLVMDPLGRVTAQA
ncbi:MAG: apolipoprotein N-acyltransferase, partial [Gemmatimonadales bacterium]|nr:apolipoprotein N-acyltransferase [Gemmatimonadales bacterium]